MFSSLNVELVFIVTIILILVVVIIKPLRDMMIWFVKDIVIPAIGWFFNYCALYVLKIFKNVIVSHFDIIKNMLYSRSVIFLTLDNQRAERDKAMNRKKGN